MDFSNIKFDLDKLQKDPNESKLIDEETKLIDELLHNGNDPDLLQELLQNKIIKENKLKELKNMQNLALSKIKKQTKEDFKQIETDYIEADKNIPQFFISVNMLYVPCQINGTYIEAFVDTGAQITIMSLDTAKKCSLEHRINTKMARKIVGVGTQISLGELYNVEILLGKYIITCNFTVMEKSHDIMFGLNTMKCHRILLDLGKGCMKIPTFNNSYFDVNFLKPSEMKK